MNNIVELSKKEVTHISAGMSVNGTIASNVNGNSTQENFDFRSTLLPPLMIAGGFAAAFTITLFIGIGWACFFYYYNYSNEPPCCKHKRSKNTILPA
jgi:hypothetical protein